MEKLVTHCLLLVPPRPFVMTPTMVVGGPKSNSSHWFPAKFRNLTSRNLCKVITVIPFRAPTALAEVSLAGRAALLTLPEPGARGGHRRSRRIADDVVALLTAQYFQSQAGIEMPFDDFHSNESRGYRPLEQIVLECVRVIVSKKRAAAEAVVGIVTPLGCVVAVGEKIGFRPLTTVSSSLRQHASYASQDAEVNLRRNKRLAQL